MRRHTRHALTSTAPPQALYDLAADVGRWPAVFAPSVAAHYLERGELSERFRLWATVGGEVKTWVSRRALDPLNLRIRFDQEESAAPIASMGGEWIFEVREDGGTDIVLLHDFTAVGDDPDTVDWINAALDRNSPLELAALARIAELGADAGDLVFSFSDTVTLDCTAQQAYAFVHRADLWPERLPHVGRVELTEDAAGVQEMEMDTVTADGAAHTTRSVRVCRPGERIAYKQLVPPRLLLGHSGVWEFTDSGAGTGARVTAEHTVVIDPAAVEEVLGAGATVADARRHLREVLGRNSRTTLELADRTAAA
ncbi:MULTISPECIES: aromatase/cyclase [Streptomyces]|uniref:Actinorhodin polyketide synthase bifunctional cyclase/dehydratase n=1 Tax=Streptomyces virginiae TaxID=1961 RepID=A0ABQ3NFZ6_STRVG|nr:MULTISPECIES: aromatase/cyclase [Streptomyces]KOU16019.1 cyclase [Streptomyces sp. WM6349]KOV02331.1 cyclase [Streptomyces sp. XY511]KOV39579.1 cyclase [Streptomyces sp. H036]MBP2346960.1 aromatase [Streptomyces virginiae]MCI4084176.1 aromatase/cyclase [Streptomyces sp. MMS21 TC-5]